LQKDEVRSVSQCDAMISLTHLLSCLLFAIK
jgi:hypothetical protein